MIDITGLKPSDVLAELVNHANVQGMGYLHDIGRPVWPQELEHLFKNLERDGKVVFDYLFGKPIKVGFHKVGDRLKIEGEYLYDRDSGAGTCQKVIIELMERLTRPEQAS